MSYRQSVWGVAGHLPDTRETLAALFVLCDCVRSRVCQRQKHALLKQSQVLRTASDCFLNHSGPRLPLFARGLVILVFGGAGRVACDTESFGLRKIHEIEVSYVEVGSEMM